MGHETSIARRGSPGTRPRWLAAVGTAAVALGTSLPAQTPAPAGATPGAGPAMTLAQGPGMTEFQTACVMCHAPDRIVGVRRTRIEWEEEIEKMIAKGAQVTDTNYGPIEDYLLRNYGKADVNRAVKDDLVLVLGLTPADADTIIAYRKAHGPLKDFDALLAVPGVDAAVLKAHREAIIY
jgi:competence protein ComEA